MLGMKPARLGIPNHHGADFLALRSAPVNLSQKPQPRQYALDGFYYQPLAVYII